MDLIATFPSSQAALRAEQALKGAAMAVELIPVPRQIRGDCGFCLLLAEAGADGAIELRRCGAQELWRVTTTQTDPSSRKVKSYERYP
jgi:hypothetical protein